MSHNFRIRTLGIQADILHLLIPNCLDTVTAYCLQDKIESFIRAGFSKYIIDLSDATYVSSAGIQVIILLQKRMYDNHGGVVLTNIPEKIYRLFAKIGVTEMCGMAETIAQALQTFESDEQPYQS
ncbi:anti-anti-sigma regulatory factor [Candidatus Vecturithrix granuli]|uniref:Anti-anti-sigma regulatory factor n=1 Tax=Vecturithrix granuli TaxID=1499967 RepID=A0A081BX03_VECG1|nr:anti-anti-sigma regulatory factor [Candidatus Vecturithrix granuli]